MSERQGRIARDAARNVWWQERLMKSGLVALILIHSLPAVSKCYELTRALEVEPEARRASRRGGACYPRLRAGSMQRHQVSHRVPAETDQAASSAALLIASVLVQTRGCP